MFLNPNSTTLLSNPVTSASSPIAEKLERVPLPFEVHPSFKCKVTRRTFTRQYAQSYNIRIVAIGPKLEAAVAQSWPAVQLKNIQGLCEFSQGEKLDKGQHRQRIAFKEETLVAIIGTVLKRQPRKPCVLDEFAGESIVLSKPQSKGIDNGNPINKYTSEDDEIILEDQTGQVQLIFTPGCGTNVDTLVNGVVIAVKGVPANGKFRVIDVMFPTPSPKPPLNGDFDIEMVFVSGLEMESGRGSPLMIELLLDYLKGLAGGPWEQANIMVKQRQVFFIGNTFGNAKDASLARKIDDLLDELAVIIKWIIGIRVPNRSSKKWPTKLDCAKLQAYLQAMPYITGLIFSTAPFCWTGLNKLQVFVVPGSSDPVGGMYPQTPIHRCVLPKSSNRSTVALLTNPSRLEVSIKSNIKLDLLLSSGEIVADGLANSVTTNPLEMAQRLIRCGILSPMCPDTLPLHPGMDIDPFILDELPHLFAIGNQPSFSSMVWKNTHIVTIPKFSESGTIILLKRNLDFIPIKFGLAA